MADLPASSTYSGALSFNFPQTGLIRRSLPNMAHSMLVHEPAKIYPYHLLLITNYRLPADVDRCNLEVWLRKYVPFYLCAYSKIIFVFLFFSVIYLMLNLKRCSSVQDQIFIDCHNGVEMKLSDVHDYFNFKTKIMPADHLWLLA